MYIAKFGGLLRGPNGGDEWIYLFQIGRLVQLAIVDDALRLCWPGGGVSLRAYLPPEYEQAVSWTDFKLHHPPNQAMLKLQSQKGTH